MTTAAKWCGVLSLSIMSLYDNDQLVTCLTKHLLRCYHWTNLWVILSRCVLVPVLKMAC